MQHLYSLGVWNWFIAGGILLGLELMVPGAFMLWLGLSALIVGVISLFIDWPWQAQVVTFAVCSLASIPAWRHLARKVEAPVDPPLLHPPAPALVRRLFP